MMHNVGSHYDAGLAQAPGGLPVGGDALNIQTSKTLWIGDVEHWMSEQDIAAQFNNIAQVTSVKLIRDKQRGMPVGYGFVEFQDHSTARDVF